MQQARKQLRKEEFLAIGPCVLSSRLLGRSGATAHYKYDLLRYRQIQLVNISAKTACTPRTQDVSRTIAHAQNIPLGVCSQARCLLTSGSKRFIRADIRIHGRSRGTTVAISCNRFTMALFFLFWIMFIPMALISKSGC